MTPRTLNTRPTDAELAELLDGAHDALFAKWLDDHYSDGTTTEEDDDLLAFVGKLREASLALEAASAEPRTYGDGEARYATPEAAATVRPAPVVPEAEKEPQKSSWPEKEGSLELAYDRSQAAAAIVRAVQRWRESLAGMSNTDPAAALDAIWQAGETLDALRED